MSSDDLKKAIQGLRKPAAAGVDLSPRSTLDALLDARLEDLEQEVEDLKGRVHGLMFLVAGAVIVQVVLSFFR